MFWFYAVTLADLLLATILSAFMAYGTLRLRGVRGLAGWRYLFLIEGAITLVRVIRSEYARIA